jgi:hypothetical protein
MDANQIISTHWGTASTSIIDDIKAINEHFEKLVGYRRLTEYELALMKRANDLLDEAFSRASDQPEDDE